MINLKSSLEYVADRLVPGLDQKGKRQLMANLTVAFTGAPFVEELVRRDDELRELLSYCLSQAPRDEDGSYSSGFYESMYGSPAYNDVATKLMRILDGESCPTCSGPIRETVGMVCQTCGKDFAPKAETVFGLAHMDWDGDHVELVVIGTVQRAQEVCDQLNVHLADHEKLEPMEFKVVR